MTNPDNIVRTRARNGGRASVYEANGWAQAFSVGLLDGSGVIQNTSPDMNVLVGGSTTKPDVVLASNPAGYKVALDIVGQQAIALTAPASNSRISSIVAYTDDLSLATSEDNITGSPSSCGLIVVNGTAASSPSAPDDATIRSAITADGATGSQASYCVIANIKISSSTTAITSSLITNNHSFVNSSMISNGSITNEKVASGISSLKLSVSTQNVSISFHMPNVLTYPVTAKLIKIGNIGILTYTGVTGFSVGPGTQNIQVTTGNVGFVDVLGGSLVYSQNSAPGCTMHYTRFYDNLVDAYVDVTANDGIEASLIIIGTLS